MKCLHRLRHYATTAALAFAGLAGCQHPNQPSGRFEGSPIGAAANSKPNPRQAADVQVALARSLEQRGETAQALAVYQEAVKRDPRRTDAYQRMAILNDRQGKFKESAELYAAALKTSPGHPDIYCDMGYSLYLQRRWAEAEMNLRQALAVMPTHARARNNLGLVLAHTERLDEALAEFRKGGGETNAQLNLAFALMLERRWDEAQKHYEAALSADPSSEAAKKGLRELNGLLAKTAPENGSKAPLSNSEQIVQVAKVRLDYQPVAPSEGENPMPGISQARTLFRVRAQEP